MHGGTSSWKNSKAWRNIIAEDLELELLSVHPRFELLGMSARLELLSA